MIIRALNAFLSWCRRLWPSRARIEIDFELWQEMIEELGRKSLGGSRETGVFLLASSKGEVRRVVKPVYFDDLDPECLVGHIHIHSIGFSKLWDICEAEDLRVIADIHTHPGSSVAQSPIDRENPMIAREGHLALIVPFYGTRLVHAREVGVHEYRGDRGWASWFGSGAERVLLIRND